MQSQPGFAGTLGFGQHPALLVIDFVNAYVTPGSPLYAAPGVPDAVAATRPLLNAARQHGLPVIYTNVTFAPDGRDGGMFVRKVPALLHLTADSPLSRIVDDLAPFPDETVINKKYASAFFGTPLASLLISHGIDTIILTGCSTSGCIRATAVDGMQYGFRVVVPRECVGDRNITVHEANLFDIQAKYGDVVSCGDVLRYIEQRND
jgi:nicotinamidase-related amidase